MITITRNGEEFLATGGDADARQDWRRRAEIACRALTRGASGAPDGLTASGEATPAKPQGAGTIGWIQVEAPALRWAGINSLDEIAACAATQERARDALWALARLAAAEAMGRGAGEAEVLVKVGAMRWNPTKPSLLYGTGIQIARGPSIEGMRLTGAIQDAILGMAIAATVLGGPRFGPVAVIDLRGGATRRATLTAEFAGRDAEDRDTVARFMEERGMGMTTPAAEAGAPKAAETTAGATGEEQ